VIRHAYGSTASRPQPCTCNAGSLRKLSRLPFVEYGHAGPREVYSILSIGVPASHSTNLPVGSTNLPIGKSLDWRSCRYIGVNSAHD